MCQSKEYRGNNCLNTISGSTKQFLCKYISRAERCIRCMGPWRRLTTYLIGQLSWHQIHQANFIYYCSSLFKFFSRRENTGQWSQTSYWLESFLSHWKWQTTLLVFVFQIKAINQNQNQLKQMMNCWRWNIMHIREDKNHANMSNFYFELIGRFGTKWNKSLGELYGKIGDASWVKVRELLR